MILVVTNETDYTADYLILELNKLGIEYVRFNTEDFPLNANIALNFGDKGFEGILKLQGKQISHHQIKSVWFRRPVNSTISPQIKDPAAEEFVINESRETLEGLWKNLSCFWVSEPTNLRIAESKPYQLKRAVELGLSIPETLITNSEQEARAFYEKHSKSIIYKPLYHSRINREDSLGLIYTNRVEAEQEKKFANVHFAPSLFQPYIQKKLEIRAIVVGEQVFSVELHSQDVPDAKYDWRRADASEIKHLPHCLPDAVNEKCISLVKSLGLVFGAIDLILTPNNKYIFLELNPNGQWAWIQQMCPEIQIKEALIRMLVKGNLANE